jgi:hypothetical protein
MLDKDVDDDVIKNDEDHNEEEMTKTMTRK